jgi:apolipoprotein N-acyltransferase
MDMKRIVIGTIVGGIVLEVLSYLVFDMAFGAYYAANTGMSGVLKVPNEQWAIAVTNFAGALLVTLGLEARGGSPSMGGAFGTGAVIGLLVWIQGDFYYYAATNAFQLIISIVDPLLSALVTGVGAVVIAAVLARVPRAAGLQPAR